MQKADTPRITVHLGAHRTATTFVQFVLKRNATRLAERGVCYSRISPETATIISKLRTSEEDADIRLAADAFVQRLQTDLPAVLLSWEGLLGLPFAGGSLYGGRGPFLRMLQLAAERLSCPIDAVLTIRRQDDLIDSWYAQLIKAGETISPKEYLSRIDQNALDWVPLVEDLQKTFRRVTVVPYELSLESATFYLQAMFGDAGIAVHALEIPPARKNPSYNSAALKIALFTNKHARFGTEERAAFRRLLLATLPDGEPATVLGTAAKDRMVKRYREQNASLLQDRSFSEAVLKRYGMVPPKKRPRSFPERLRGRMRRLLTFR